MKEIQSMLKIVSDGLKMIAKGIEAISEKVDEIAKSQTLEEQIAKKAAPPAVTKKKPARKTAAKAQTAAETVYDVISKSEGVNTETLMKETGYNRKKVANMVYNLSKKGRIKSIEKGVYVKA